MSGLIRTLLRLFYFLIYHPFAWTYDAVAALVSAGYWRRWVLAMLDEIEGESLLELGHGPGHLQLALHQSGRWALGLDRSRQMGRLASRRLLKQCAPVRLSNAVSQQLPFPTGHFDEVVATFPTDYIIDPLTLAEIRRVLGLSGRLLVLAGGIPTGKSAQARFAALRFKLTGQAVRSLEPWQNPLADPIRRQGFKVEVVNRTIGQSQITLLRCQVVDRPGPSSSG